MKRFPLIVGALLASVFIGLALLGYRSAPDGTRWLGDGIHNSSDVAVYFSYLRQGADGHTLLSDLFAVEPHRLRFDAVWSTLGLVARTGVNPIVIHEAARAIFILLLVVALWYAARSQEKDDRDANLATLLALGGISTGWIYSIWLGANNLWTPQTYAAPDVVTEFAVGPVLFGGAHMILSVALLITCLRLLWDGITMDQRQKTLFGALAGAALLSFHPYFAPLVGLMGLLAFASRWKEAAARRERFASLALAGILTLPPVAYALYLLTDPVFGTHHLVDNLLPLNTPLVWLITLAPFIIAFVWMWRTNHLPKKFDWPSAWLLAVILLLIFLPVPWKRKLTEGLLIPLVFLTMPAWRAVREWLREQRPRPMRIFLTALFLLAAWLGPLHLIVSQLTWFEKKDAQHFFYQPHSLFEVAEYLHTQKDHPILLSDDRWVNLWLPALSGQRVWIGHDHETPHFKSKREVYQKLLATTDSKEAQGILEAIGVTHFITTDQKSQARFADLLSPKWTIDFQRDEDAVWKRGL